MADVRPLTHRELVEWLDRWKDVVPVVADDALLEVLRDLVGEVEGYVDNTLDYDNGSWNARVGEGKPCPGCDTGAGYLPDYMRELCALHRAKELLKRLDTGAGK